MRGFWRRPHWNKEIVELYKRPGRKGKLDLPSKILVLLLYDRSYITQEFVGYLFGLHKAQVCQHIAALEPLLARVMAISKTRHLSEEEIQTLIVDAFKQRIERPKHNQKAFYSGKKKCHTHKTEIRMTPHQEELFTSQKHALALFMILRFTNLSLLFLEIQRD